MVTPAMMGAGRPSKGPGSLRPVHSRGETCLPPTIMSQWTWGAGRESRGAHGTDGLATVQAVPGVHPDLCQVVVAAVHAEAVVDEDGSAPHIPGPCEHDGPRVGRTNGAVIGSILLAIVVPGGASTGLGAHAPNAATGVVRGEAALTSLFPVQEVLSRELGYCGQGPRSSSTYCWGSTPSQTACTWSALRRSGRCTHTGRGVHPNKKATPRRRFLSTARALPPEAPPATASRHNRFNVALATLRQGVAPVEGMAVPGTFAELVPLKTEGPLEGQLHRTIGPIGGPGGVADVVAGRHRRRQSSLGRSVR